MYFNFKILFLLLKLFATPLLAHEFPEEDFCYKAAKMNFLHDTENKYNEQTAYQELTTRKLLKPNQIINFGSTSKPVWIYLKVNINHNNFNFQKCVFTLDNPLLDKIKIFEVLDDRTIKFLNHLGDSFPFRERYYRHRNYVFPYQANQNKEFLFQLKTTSNMTVPIKVQWRDEYFDHVTLDYLYLGCFYGIMFVFVFFGLHNFIAQRNSAYLLFSLYALALLIFFIDRDGIAFQLFWPEANLFKQKTPRIFAVIAMIFGVSYYLKLISVRCKSLIFASKTYIYLSSIFCISLAFIDPAYTQIPTIIFALGQSVFMILISKYALNKDKEFSPYLLAGSIIALVGLVIHSLGISNLSAANFFTHNAMKFATIIDFILLSIAIQKKLKLSLDKSAKYEGIQEISAMIVHDIRAPYDKLEYFFTKASALPESELKKHLERFKNIILADFTAVIDMISDLKHMGVQHNRHEITSVSIIAQEDNWPFKLNLEYEGSINIDRVSLKRIIENLKKNALEATKTRSDCVYWINVVEFFNKIKITVGNTGSKISPDDFSEVFELFYTRGKEHGSGIGLSFVYKKAKYFGGYVTIESNGVCSKRGKVDKKFDTDYVEINVVLKKGVPYYAPAGE